MRFASHRSARPGPARPRAERHRTLAVAWQHGRVSTDAHPREPSARRSRADGERVLLDGTHRAGPVAPGENVRVFIADDHALYRRGLQLVLDSEPDIEVVGECGDGAGAVAAVTELVPDVVLMDVRMPGGGGIDACTGIVEAAPQVRVVMLTTSDDERDLVDSIRAGAVGYLLKDIPPEEVVDGVRAVRSGRSLLSPSLASGLLTEYATLLSRSEPTGVGWARPADPAPGPRLTDRELEVLRLLARAMSNKEIGRHLFISENTVKNHVRNILEKLRLHSRTEAATYAVRARLVEGPGA